MVKKKRNSFMSFLISFCMIIALIPAYAFADSEETPLPESEHPYANSYDNTWSYTADNAENGVYVTFDDQTETEKGYDFIYISDADDNQIGKYSGTSLANSTVYVPTSTVKIRLTSDKSGDAYGFKVTGIEAAGSTIDLEKVGTVDEISPAEVNEEPEVVVRVNGNILTKDTDYTVSFAGNNAVGKAIATIEGKGKYSGKLTAEFSVFDENNKTEIDVAVKESNISLRQTADWNNSLASYNGASGYIPLENATTAYLKAIESVELSPVDKDGTATATGEKSYPAAPVSITLEKKDRGTLDEKDGKWFVNSDNGRIYFYRTSEDPVVYVMENHEPIDITGRWGTNTYPQSQIYQVTVKARGYADITGSITYYTGTSPDFSIIIDEDGDSSTTDDQTVAKSWTSDEIEKMSTFANGSSQCGMTGFRSFSGMGVSLKDMLNEAGVTVSEDDYFLLDTSDHYGNKFTYDELFNTTRYFLSSVYNDEEVADTYHELVKSDDEAGATTALRRLLAEKAKEAETTVEPRINVTYEETLLYSDDVGKTEIPTEENTDPSKLVSYENQFRFFYGIALVQDDVNVTFDSQGGTEVDPQLVKSHMMTSTDNTTIKSSYWASSLVIYRGEGKNHTTEPSAAADKITVPDNPERDGYVFIGWYKDKECTERFDFSADGGTVDQDTTLYAGWIEENKAVQITDYDGYTERDENNQVNSGMGEGDEQILNLSLTFAEPMKITDKEALIKELKVKFGNPVYEPADVSLSQDGKTLNVVVKGWAAAYSGQVTIMGVMNNLVSADGNKEAVTEISFIVPNGVKTEVKKQVIADEKTNASVSTKLSVDKETTRGMVHIVLLKNGKPAAETNSYGGNFVAHYHDYMNLTAEKYAGMFLGFWKNSNLADDYTLSVDGDTVTVTANSSEPGDVLELHIASYLNSGEKAVDDTALNELIEKAEAKDLSAYTKATADALNTQIKLAKVVAADTTYYAQTDIDQMTARLQNAMDNVIPNVKAPAKVTANLYDDYDELKVTWSKVDGAAGYYVYYKKSTWSNFKLLRTTTKLSCIKANLTDGAKYCFRIYPYVKVNGRIYKDGSYRTSSYVYTLKKLNNPSVSKSAKLYVKVSWNNIYGESGYQIARSKSSNRNFSVVKTVSYKYKSATVKTKRGTSYYYRVRAYKTVNGKKIYGPWSSVKKYTLK